MSMIGNYHRIEPKELRKILKKPSLITALLCEDPPSREFYRRHLDIDKSWDVIDFLAGDGYAVTTPEVTGEPIGKVDVCYGPARYLTAREVKLTAAYLAKLPPRELKKRFDPKKLKNVYHNAWKLDDWDYIKGYYVKLVAFFKKAAAAGDAMILYLN